MEMIQILREITDVQDLIQGSPAGKLLDDTAQKIKQEIVRSTIKAGQRQQYNAVLSFAKHCAGSPREAMAGAYMADIYGEPHQVMIDGFVAIAFIKPWEGLPEVKKGVKPIDAAAVYEGANKGMPTPLPDLYEMIAANKVYKATEGKFDSSITKIGITYANTDYLIRIMKMLNITGGECLVNKTVGPIYFETYQAKALVLPVKVFGDGKPLTLPGNSDAKWREWIGNMVPVQAATAMGNALLATMLPNCMGDWHWDVDGNELWVRPEYHRIEKAV